MTNITLEQIRENYGIFEFKNIERGQHKIVGNQIGTKRETISKAVDEAKILSFFPKLEKSKAVPLARLRTNKELKLFSEKYAVYSLEVRSLYKLVKEWRKSVEENPRIILTELQHDLIIGSTFGDANIRQRNKNCMFRVGHSPKQKEYVEWKFEILKMFPGNGIKLWQRIVNGRLVNTYNFDINTHYAFNFYRKLFYNNNGDKIITKEVLEQLNPRSLAIWLCDDGSYCRKLKYIILSTNSFSLNEHKLMKSFFKKKWNLNPTIGFRDNKYYYLRFKVEDTKKLIEIVRPHILNCMKYKIGEENEQ